MTFINLVIDLTQVHTGRSMCKHPGAVRMEQNMSASLDLIAYILKYTRIMTSYTSVR